MQFISVIESQRRNPLDAYGISRAEALVSQENLIQCSMKFRKNVFVRTP